MPADMPATARTDVILLVLAALFGAMAVACGAYAAHGLAAVRDARAVTLWQTASLYQMVHALAILAVVALRRGMGRGRGSMALAGGLFALGCVLFPGALYLLGWYGPGALGAVAPLGGLSFILGWLMLGVAGLRQYRNNGANGANGAGPGPG